MAFKNYHQILGVSPHASQHAIKQAYRRLARKYHPDVSAFPDAEDRFKEIGEAYEVLKGPQKGATDEVLHPSWSAGHGSTRSYGRPESSGTQRMAMNGFGPILFFVVGAFMFAHFHSAGDPPTPARTPEPAQPMSVEVQAVSESEKVTSFVSDGEPSDHDRL